MATGAGAILRRISLRARLTVLSVALIGILVLVSGAGTITMLRTYLLQNTDSILKSTAVTLAVEDPTLVEARLATNQLQLPPLPSDYYIAYLDPTGQLSIAIVSSASPTKSVPNLSNFTTSSVNLTHGTPFNADVVDAKIAGGHKVWRMVAVPLTNFPGSLVVALPTSTNEALITQYQLIALGFGLVILVLSTLALWLTISSALRPLEEVERTSAAIAEGDISRRLEEIGGKTEIARLNHSLNTMLNSIEGAIVARNMTLEQMRQFVADASHELRTPLVSVRGYAELYRMGALKKDEDVANAMGRIEAEAVRMTQLVESLLALARLDDAAPLSKNTIDLVALARDAATDINAAERRQTTIVVDLDGRELDQSATLLAPADPSSMRQVLTNLLANAARFSQDGSTVELALGTSAEGFVIEVRDHGEGIPAELRERVFERFYRTDSSRNRETGGSGLGLSIVRSIIDRHRGQIVASETPGGGATFRVWLPKT
ncbi:MAG: hypothetical protein RLZZ626_513 [Actinomycetota bacterium]|jgi:two-component system OmpR family sensor kinase